MAKHFSCVLREQEWPFLCRPCACGSFPLQDCFLFLKTAGGKKGLKIFPLCTMKRDSPAAMRLPPQTPTVRINQKTLGQKKRETMITRSTVPSSLVENVIWISSDQNGKLFVHTVHLSGTNVLICCDNSVFCVSDCQSPGDTHGMSPCGSACQA